MGGWENHDDETTYVGNHLEAELSGVEHTEEDGIGLCVRARVCVFGFRRV